MKEEVEGQTVKKPSLFVNGRPKIFDEWSSNVYVMSFIFNMIHY